MDNWYTPLKKAWILFSCIISISAAILSLFVFKNHIEKISISKLANCFILFLLAIILLLIVTTRYFLAYKSKIKELDRINQELEELKKRDPKMYDISFVKDQNTIYLKENPSIRIYDLLKFDMETNYEPKTIGYGYCADSANQEGDGYFVKIAVLGNVIGCENEYNQLLNGDIAYLSNVKVRRVLTKEDYNNIAELAKQSEITGGVA